jgi:protease-4
LTPPAIDILRTARANLARATRRALDRAALPRREGFWLTLRVADLDERPPFGFPLGQHRTLGLLEILETLAAAAEDPQVDGVLLNFAGPLGGFSKLLSLRRAVTRLRDAKIPVAAYAETLDAESLLVASAADRIWLPESGNAHLVGLRLETLFVKGALDRLGLAPEVVRVGTHKSAGERFTRERMSTEAREQLEALADDFYAELVEGIAAGRGLTPEVVRDLIDRGPYHARSALEAGLVDGCLYPDELEAELWKLTPEPPPERPGPRLVRRVEAGIYHALRVGDARWRLPLADFPRIAYVTARGTIVRGRRSRGIASEAYGALFDHLRRDPGVRAVVLRIDSGGGDAIASDLLWRSVAVTRREKPVVVSMGDIVASGGYYMASAADEVLAEAGSITGSIGVVGGKLNLAGLYERIGVSKESVERGARAGLLSESRGFTPDEKRAIRGEMDALYTIFVDRVAEGRGLSHAEIRKVAEGRIWSGARALQIGLVDAIGGPLEALCAARRRAGLGRDEPVFVERHPRVARLPGLGSLMQWIPGR